MQQLLDGDAGQTQHSFLLSFLHSAAAWPASRRGRATMVRTNFEDEDDEDDVKSASEKSESEEEKPKAKVLIKTALPSHSSCIVSIR